MCKSQRLEGLELLRLIGAPVPRWQVVEDSHNVDALKLQPTNHGWTIRTCRRDGQREMNLFYLNYADPRTVVRILRERLIQFGNKEFYIVYPSWRFRFSCNVLSNSESVRIEGKYGSQKDLSSGKALPDFGLLIPFGIRNRMTSYVGEPDDEVLSWLGRIVWWCKRIPRESFYSEVALTQDAEIIFYELFSV